MDECTTAGISRRGFLVTVPLMGWSLSGLTFLPQLTDKIRDDIRGRLLELVNAERYLAGVNDLEFDELAGRVAMGHAADMARGSFLSHWGSDGRKPYHRYSFAGGIHATQENAASIDSFFSADWKNLAEDLVHLHVRMHSEKPPNDGHRKAILAPQHTHVGFGFAASERRLRLVELYVAKYMEVVGFRSRAGRNETFHLSGRLLNSNHKIQQIDIFYEPLPVSREERAHATEGSYGLPDEFETLRPRLNKGVRYVDGTTGVIEVKQNGRFEVPVKLFKPTAGIYTIVFWIRKKPFENAFPATEICIETE